MDPSTFKKRFEELIASSGIPLASLTPHAGLELILRFYGENPTGPLSCTWGPVTLYGAEELGFGFTHWFNVDDPPTGEPCYLSLRFKIGPRTMAGEFSEGVTWCCSLDEIEACRSKFASSPPFLVWGQSAAAGVALGCESMSSWAHALFDCWGERDPSRPIVSMTEEEWLRSDDIGLMLRWFRQEWRGEEADLNRLLQRYLLACCRKIWRLLPMEASRRGIEVAERHIEGIATDEELARVEWDAEAATFYLDPLDESPAPEVVGETHAEYRYDVERKAHQSVLAKEVEAIPPEEFQCLVRLTEDDTALSPRELLASAANFAFSSMLYFGLTPKESIERYRHFMPTPLLREVVGNAFRSASGVLPAQQPSQNIDVDHDM